MWSCNSRPAVYIFPNGRIAQKISRSNQFPEESRLSANSSKGLLSSVPGNCSMREAISRFSSTSTVLPNVSSHAVNNEKLPSYQSTLVAGIRNHAGEIDTASLLRRSPRHGASFKANRDQPASKQNRRSDADGDNG